MINQKKAVVCNLIRHMTICNSGLFSIKGNISAPMRNWYPIKYVIYEIGCATTDLWNLQCLKWTQMKPCKPLSSFVWMVLLILGKHMTSVLTTYSDDPGCALSLSYIHTSVTFLIVHFYVFLEPHQSFPLEGIQVTSNYLFCKLVLSFLPSLSLYSTPSIFLGAFPFYPFHLPWSYIFLVNFLPFLR